MAANLNPIFPLTPNIKFVTLITADASYTVPTTAGAVIFTAGVNGSKVDQIKARALGTNVQTVLRLFVNDGLGVLAANFTLVYEKMLPASTAAATDITGIDIDILIPKDTGVNVCPIPYLAPGQKIYASIGTTVAAGWSVSAYGGDY